MTHLAQREVSLCGIEQIIGAQMFGTGAGRDVLEVACVAPTGSYRRAAPVLIDSSDADYATRESIGFYGRVLTQNYRSILRTSFRDAMVAGQGALVLASNLLVTETVIEYTFQNALPAGFSQAAEGRFHLPAQPHLRIAAPCLLLKKPWYFNFGHWLVDCASVLALCAELVAERQLTLVIGQYEGAMRGIVMETIARLAPGAPVLEHPDDEIWRFDELHYVTPPHAPPLFNLPEGLRRLRNAFLPASAPKPAARLFIARRDSGHRILQNETELFALCAARGFQLVDPQKMSLAGQAECFAGAAAIVGAKGAALTNCLFCAPGAKILVLSPADFPDPFYWEIASQAGCHYAEIFGPVTTRRHAGLNDFTIDPEKFTRALDLLTTGDCN